MCVCMSIIKHFPPRPDETNKAKAGTHLRLKPHTHTHTAAHELIIEGHARIMAPLEVDGMWCVNRMFVGIKHNARCS